MSARRAAVMTREIAAELAPSKPALRVVAKATDVVRAIAGAQPSEAVLRERAQILMNRMSTKAASVVAYREEVGDYGDMSEHNQEEWLFVSRNAADNRELREVEHALERLKDGVYGICQRCDEPISPKRLQAVPWAKYCIHCQENRDN